MAGVAFLFCFCWPVISRCGPQSRATLCTRAGSALSASSSSVDGLWPKFFSSAKFPSMFSIGDEHHEYCLLFGYLSGECSSHQFCDQDSKCLFWTWFLLLHLRSNTVHTRASAGFLRTFGRYVLKNMRPAAGGHCGDSQALHDQRASCARRCNDY